MYESYFQLTDRPFAAVPKIEQYYPARAIEAARRTLIRCIDRAEGVGIVIGPSGVGKTLVCQLLAHQFRDVFEIAMLGQTRVDSPRSLLQAILFDLRIECRGLNDGDLRLALVDHLTRDDTKGAGLLLLADEAHMLPARVLEEIRLITNVTVAGEPRVRCVMAGAPLLEEHLASPKLESFTQRAAARCYLDPLDRQETGEYVRAQMAAAGVDSRSIFSADALSGVFNASDGIPRLINQVCDHALVLAAANGASLISQHDIDAAWADLQQLPTPWNGSGEKRGSNAVIEFGQLDDEPLTPAKDREAEREPIALRLAQGLDDVDFDTEQGPEQRLEVLEKAVTSLDTGATAVGVSSVSVSTDSDPFAEQFDQEEVVVDRYQTSSPEVWDQMPHVYSSEGAVLAKLLETVVETAAAAEVAAAPTSWAEHAEDDLIIVEDDPTILPAGGNANRVVRTEYSQLFAKLRRG